MTVPETPDLDLDAIQRTFRHATTCAVRRASAGGDYLRACDCGRDDRLIASLRAAQTERDRLREALLEIVRRADPVDDITRINRERLREEFAAHHAGPMVGIFEDLEWTTVRARAALSAPRPT